MIEKLPIAIHIISHKDFLDREEYNNEIYATFSKDLNDYLSRGINIPVFCYDSDKCVIRKHKYEKNIVVILIDDKLVLDKRENNLDYITDDKGLSIISFAISKFVNTTVAALFESSAPFVTIEVVPANNVNLAPTLVAEV